MPWGKFVLIFGAAWFLQAFLSYRQARHYQATIREMKAGRKGFMGIGVVRRKLGPGAAAILVTDLIGTVVEGRAMSGVSVFARFKPLQGVSGQPVEALREMPPFAGKSSVARAVSMAIDNIKAQREQAGREAS